ncbi:c-type cytochrome [Pseudomonas batumici]|uniref:c-type cytochrome n=1 Tax=Pseudomonas batumici TaxID=226910 RepID=UPI0030CFA304
MNKKGLWLGVLTLTVCGAALAGALMWRPSLAPVKQHALQNAEQVMRGARVVEAGDCAVCHTRPGGGYLAGGLALVTPFGTLYSTNITPDDRTGIGEWSLEAFERAMRHGISRDGHFLYPAFPYAHYRRMSDGDLQDAYAYLMSGPPVDSPARPNQMNFPMNIRPLVSFWNLLFLHGEQPQSESRQTAQWNRGRYLMEGAGHCASCHSPLNLLGAEKSGQSLAGGMVDGWEAPSLLGLAHAHKPWDSQQLVGYLRGEVAADHGAAAGPMRPVSLSLAKVPVSDVQAIAEYLLSLDAHPSAEPRSASPDIRAVDPTAQNEGAALFQTSCAGCHGPGAPMRLIDGRPDLADTSAMRSATSRNFIKTVQEGIAMTPGASGPGMPAFAATLNEAQLTVLATYLRARAEPDHPWADLSDTIATLREDAK